MEFHGMVTRHDPPYASTVVMTGQYFDIEADYVFEDVSGRTRLTQRATVKGRGFFNVMMVLFGWLMRRGGCRAQANELNNLKRLLESRERSTNL
jgi:hypothetical protein